MLEFSGASPGMATLALPTSASDGLAIGTSIGGQIATMIVFATAETRNTPTVT